MRKKLSQRKNLSQTQVVKNEEKVVTKKLSQEFIRTVNHILGAHFRLDDFLMNPLLQGYSRTTPETSRNAYGKNLRVIFILKRAFFRVGRHEKVGQKMVTTWLQEFTRKSHAVPSVHLQKSRKRTTLPVNRISKVRMPLQLWKQTKFCWPLSSWHTTTVLQTLITISTEFSTCQSLSPQRCPLSTGNPRNWTRLEIVSKRVSKFTTS